LAEADPRGGWATVLMTLPTEIRCENLKLNRRVHLKDFIKDAYTTALAHDELVTEVAVKIPPAVSGVGTFQNLSTYVAMKKRVPGGFHMRSASFFDQPTVRWSWSSCSAATRMPRSALSMQLSLQ
jgi:FAD binding domain in molybdopterin dehydrogenase